MSGAQHIPWFNPREMSDATLLQLSTGRETLLKQAFGMIQQRIAHPALMSHWLLTGNRGAGKSFFLRLVEANFKQHFAQQARFVLLPEELRNIYAPHELLSEIQRLLAETPQAGSPPQWKTAEPRQAWQQELDKLLKLFDEPLLVVGIENFDELLKQAFADDVSSSLLRHLMSNEPRIMLLATALHGSFDEEYDKRMFRQFEHYSIDPWNGQQHRDYLSQRAKHSNIAITDAQLARIDAYSLYTGGNARAAAILAGTILEQYDPLAAATDLDAAIEKMSDYYRDLIARMPINTRKLFDALLRGGEPASQTEIAHRVGASQNDISRAFIWLIDQGYVTESRLPKQKNKQYSITDRLLVQYYRMRYLYPGQRSKLSVLAELLADTLQFRDKWRFAQQYFTDGEEKEALTLVELALNERHIDFNQLLTTQSSTHKLCNMGEAWQKWDEIVALPAQERFGAILQTYASDDAMRQVIEQLVPLASAKQSGDIAGSTLVPLLMSSLLLSPAEKLQVLIHLVCDVLSTQQWQKLKDTFIGEANQFLALRATEAEEVERLESNRQTGVQYPYSMTLSDIASLSINILPPDAIIGYASLAPLNWLQIGDTTRAEAALENYLRLLHQVVTQCYADEQVALTSSLQLLSVIARFSDDHQARLHQYIGLLQVRLAHYADAYQQHQLAYQIWLAKNVPANACWNLGKMAWCLGRQGKHQQAFELHQQVWQTRLAQDQLGSAAWNLGQMACHHLLQADLNSAWQLLQQHMPQVDEHKADCIQQLGDAIADIAQQQGEAAAFATGQALLQTLAQHSEYDTEKILRALWVGMVEMMVPFTLLRDLLEEWPHVFVEQMPVLQMLQEVLFAWLDDLATPAEQRLLRRQTLDPDLALTLQKLSDALPKYSQKQLGLLGAGA